MSFNLKRSLCLDYEIYKAGMYYQQGDYEKALLIYTNVLAANYHIQYVSLQMARIGSHLGDYDQAIIRLKQSYCIKFGSDYEKLLNKWQVAIENRENHLESLDTETESVLSRLQNDRSFEWKELFSPVLLGFFASILIALPLQAILPKNFLEIVSLCLYASFLGVYYYRKPSLVPIFPIALTDAAKTTKRLFTSRQFLRDILILAVINLLGPLVLRMIFGIRPDLNNYTRVFIASSLLPVPIIEEIVFRGILYSSLKKMFPRYAVYVSALFFAIGHGLGGLLFLFLAGYIFTLCYEREKTILAPIFLHVLFNVLYFTDWLVRTKF